MRSWFDDMLVQSKFIERFPWFTEILAKLEPVRTSRAGPCMMVALHRARDSSYTYRLYVDVGYFRDHPEDFAPVLQHEIHHVIYGHLIDPHLTRAPRPDLMSLAMEMSANENIKNAPEGVITWEQFSHLGIEPLQSTRKRYALLCEAEAAGQLFVVHSIDLDRMLPGWRKAVPSESSNHTGSVLVTRQQDNLLILRIPEFARIGPFGGRGDRGLGDVLDASRRTFGPPTGSAQMEAWKAAIREHLGGVPGGGGDGHRAPALSKDLPRPCEAAKGQSLPWASILRRILPTQRTAQATWTRPNRRFPLRVGEVPGRHRRPRRMRLLVVIDTSASMDARALGRVAREVNRVGELAEVVIAEADAKVRRVYPLRDRGDFVLGGGDTDFSPALAGPELAGRLYDAVLYFTDGRGPWPQGAPAIPVILALTEDGAPRPSWIDADSVLRIPPAAEELQQPPTSPE